MRKFLGWLFAGRAEREKFYEEKGLPVMNDTPPMPKLYGAYNHGLPRMIVTVPMPSVKPPRETLHFETATAEECVAAVNRIEQAAKEKISDIKRRAKCDKDTVLSFYAKRFREFPDGTEFVEPDGNYRRFRIINAVALFANESTLIYYDVELLMGSGIVCNADGSSVIFRFGEKRVRQCIIQNDN